MMDYQRKGEFKGSIGTIITLVTGIGVAVLVLIFVGVLGGQTYELVEDDIAALLTTVVNDSQTVLNSTAVSLANDYINNGTMTVLNSSVAVGLGNFSFDYDDGTVTLLTEAYNNTALDFSYRYGQEEIVAAIQGGFMSGFSALESTGSYLPLIVLAVVIALILGLVLGMTGSTGGSMTTKSAL